MLVVSMPDGVAEPFAYDEERTVLLMDSWHQSVYEHSTSSLLITAGRGMLNCSSLARYSRRRPDCVPLAGAVHCRAGEDLPRLRVGSLTSVNFDIEAWMEEINRRPGHGGAPASHGMQRGGVAVTTRGGRQTRCRPGVDGISNTVHPLGPFQPFDRPRAVRIGWGSHAQALGRRPWSFVWQARELGAWGDRRTARRRCSGSMANGRR